MTSNGTMSALPNDSNFTIVINQSWFIPFDIINILSPTLAILLSLVFISLIIFDKTCHTVSMILVFNSLVAQLFTASVLLWMVISTFINDLYQRYYRYSYCTFQGYISYVAVAGLFYSYFLQAIYRYLIVVYPTQPVWQSTKFQCFLIIGKWIVSFLYAFPHLFTGKIIYHVNDQICQMPLHLSIIAVYNIIYIYLIPMNGIMFIYFKLIRYVKEMNKHVTPANTLLRVQRELKMVRRIVVIVFILLVFGSPYATFTFMGFFAHPPKYHFRIANTFCQIALPLITIALFKFTDPLRISLMGLINRQRN
ncbi:unnamed protein product [Adineta ricciae]|uniref:G-protein coupled receptors family 1 profile domain-containing protein n=1 Tax=Adineta ricciae TaxID=249248 RepID=A0A816C0C6_ADIRI|nr:unnamed protein product [Adineta ricciae]CAF1614248.1 unnamed protein product [Adineta ricciae]